MPLISKLVVLDKNDFNEKQKQELEALAKETVIFEDLPKDDGEAIERIGNAEALLVCWYSLSEKCVDACSSLKYFGVVATGYGWLAAEYAAKKGITVTNVPGYSTKAVSEFTFKQLGDYSLKGKIVGVIGLGRIGAAIAQTASKKGASVICWNRTSKNSEFRAASFEEVFKKADVIVLQVKSCEETQSIVKNKLNQTPILLTLQELHGSLLNQCSTFTR